MYSCTCGEVLPYASIEISGSYSSTRAFMASYASAISGVFLALACHIWNASSGSLKPESLSEFVQALKLVASSPSKIG